MFASIFARVLPFRAVAALALLAALVAAVGVQTMRLDRAQLKSNELAAKLVAAVVLVTVQNEGIEALAVAAAKQREASAKAARSAAKALARAESKAVQIEAAETPETCDEAIRFLVHDAGESQ